MPPSDADRSRPPVGVDRAHVLEALARLSPDHRHILLECHFRGVTVTEAAATLGIAADTVKSRICFALRSFGLALAEVSG